MSMKEREMFTGQFQRHWNFHGRNLVAVATVHDTGTGIVFDGEEFISVCWKTESQFAEERVEGCRNRHFQRNSSLLLVALVCRNDVVAESYGCVSARWERHDAETSEPQRELIVKDMSINSGCFCVSLIFSSLSRLELEDGCEATVQGDIFVATESLKQQSGYLTTIFEILASAKFVKCQGSSGPQFDLCHISWELLEFFVTDHRIKSLLLAPVNRGLLHNSL
jgi:hypothetical protein